MRNVGTCLEAAVRIHVLRVVHQVSGRRPASLRARPQFLEEDDPVSQPLTRRTVRGPGAFPRVPLGGTHTAMEPVHFIEASVIVCLRDPVAVQFDTEPVGTVVGLGTGR